MAFVHQKSPSYDRSMFFSLNNVAEKSFYEQNAYSVVYSIKNEERQLTSKEDA